MDRPIQVGDLVQVVKAPHNHSEKHLGLIYRVSYIHPLNPKCPDCGQLLAYGDTPLCEKEPTEEEHLALGFAAFLRSPNSKARKQKKNSGSQHEP